MGESSRASNLAISKSGLGKIAVLTPGIGAVATTLFAGVEAVKKGISLPIGSYTQMGKINIGDASQGCPIDVQELVPLAQLDEIIFGGWDIFGEDAYEAAVRAQVLAPDLLRSVKDELSSIKAMPAVFDRDFVKRLNGSNVKIGRTKMDLANQLREDIRSFMSRHRCDRAVVVWCGSTEVYTLPSDTHKSLRHFEEGLKNNDSHISPSQIYTYAALKEGIPYANGSPNVSVEMPCMQELALEMDTPISGSDFKTGQTLIKTVLAPGLRNRQLGVTGWFSTNILGNRDGEVLDDRDSFRSKEASKSGVLEDILSAKDYPDLYGEMSHLVKINYYPPRGDNKEGWDNIDLFGWLGYPMQLKINFLCRDSILAAPLSLDLALFMDLAKRAGLAGIQEWLSFYYKAPLTPNGKNTENDLTVQLLQLENKLQTIVEKVASSE